MTFRSINLLIHILKYYNYNHHCSLRQIGVVHDIFVEVERVAKYYIIRTMEVHHMKGKQKVIIGIIAAVVVVGIVAAVVLGMRRGKSDKTINVGNATESDEMSSWRTDGHRVAKAESGYYYLYWSDTDSTTMLKYFDDSTHKTIPVCAKAECMHNSADCNAVLDSSYDNSPLHYYKGSLYVVKVEGGMAKLERIAKDGSSREDVADLFASDNGTVSLVFHDDCVYAYDRIGHMGAVESKDTDKVVIVKAELANGKTSEVFSYEGANNAIVMIMPQAAQNWYLIRIYLIIMLIQTMEFCTIS